MAKTIQTQTATIKMNNGDVFTYKAPNATQLIRYVIAGSSTATLEVEGEGGAKTHISGRNISSFTVAYSDEEVVEG